MVQDLRVEARGKYIVGFIERTKPLSKGEYDDLWIDTKIGNYQIRITRVL